MTDNLPPLPHPVRHDFVGDDTEDLFAAGQMRAYAAQAVAAERERWAAIAKSHMDLNTAMGAKEKARTAASILAEGIGA